MAQDWLVPAYQLIARLLLHPDDRDGTAIAAAVDRLAGAPAPVHEPVQRFLADPRAASGDEYVQTLELSPPCPLYLGAYLFDEPTTCRGIGASGRNHYMLELVGMYRHFGIEIAGGELPDYLPAMADFLWISLGRVERDGIGLRRRFLEAFVRPALPRFREALAEYHSPYSLLAGALEAAVSHDLELMGDAPAWRPPSPERRERPLPVLAGPGAAGTTAAEVRP